MSLRSPDAVHAAAVSNAANAMAGNRFAAIYVLSRMWSGPNRGRSDPILLDPG